MWLQYISKNNSKAENIYSDDDEIEELLVDDFDGQCSRTYPDNHSKIVKWRESRKGERKLNHNGSSFSEAHLPSSSVNSLAAMKEVTSDIRCKSWAKTDNSRTSLDNSNANGSDTKKFNRQSSILSDHESDFAAKKRRLMASSSLDHSKSTTTLTTESNSTGTYNC